ATEQARANHLAAQGNLAKAVAQQVDAQRQAARSKQLVEQKLIAQADYDTAQSNADAAAATVKAAEGAVAQAKAALHQAEVNLAYTDIRSPTSGTVISRNVDVGQTVAASLQAPTLFVIAEDLAKMQVDTSVAEADVGRLRDGMSATFTVDAFPGETFKGVVRQVRNAAQTVQNVVTYDAVVDVSNPDLKLRPGMTATVTFVYDDKEDALRVPNAAVRFRPPAGMPRAGAAPGAGRTARADDGGQARGGAVVPAAAGGTAPRGAPREQGSGKVVFVLRPGAKPEAVVIHTGVSDGTFTEVVSGELHPGDLVITDANGPAGAGASGGAPGGMGPRRGPF
ncbi:MAG TPA: efflux RND transporter periplasmic adaptor subunit, partial [Anaeromyxobacter sp.]|nr:efflux RND transporter periplasmic adaptor subunit [Anaeromyxobacter sp.]